VRGERSGVPFTLRIQVHGAVVDDLELTAGSPGRDRSSAALGRRKGVRGRKVKLRTRSGRVALADAELNDQFEAHDDTGVLAGLLADPEVARRAEAALHGALWVWPGEGVRYQARPGRDGFPVPMAEVAFDPQDAGIEEVQALVALLVEVAQGTGVG